MADNKYKLQFTLSNGETINAGEIVAPQGPKGDKGDSADIPYSSSTPFMDGVGSVGSANTVARGDHRHPSDTSRQEKLISGTNIKTINGQSVLGSGDILISGGGTIDVDTLIALLSGSNGIAIAKNAAGDKVEVKIPDKITISNSQGKARLSPQTISLFYSPDNVSFLIDGLAGGIYKTRGSEQQWYLHQGNVKTLFGNQSIYGSGNIDLYRHIVWIKNDISGHKVYVTVHIISSSNTPIDSLTDLFTVLSAYANEWYPCNGRVELNSTDRGVAYNFNARSTSNGAIAFLKTDGTERYYEWAAHSTGLTVRDIVTTV